MSLTSFLETDPELRAFFRDTFPKPGDSIRQPVVAPPKTNHWQTVGTAFDYVLRWRLESLHPFAEASGPWVAEQALAFLRRSPELFEPAERHIAKTKQRVAKYVVSGRATNSLFAVALVLARLDPVFRSGLLPETWSDTCDPSDIDDLRALYSVVPMAQFGATSRCLLNPSFHAATLVGGADADMVLDDLLIDVKVTKDPKMWREYFNQLLGYYLLYRLGGFSVGGRQPALKRLGLYMARQGHLYIWQTRDIASEKVFARATQWFAERARTRTRIRGLTSP